MEHNATDRSKREEQMNNSFTVALTQSNSILGTFWDTLAKIQNHGEAQRCFQTLLQQLHYLNRQFEGFLGDDEWRALKSYLNSVANAQEFPFIIAWKPVTKDRLAVIAF